MRRHTALSSDDLNTFSDRLSRTQDVEIRVHYVLCSVYSPHTISLSRLPIIPCGTLQLT